MHQSEVFAQRVRAGVGEEVETGAILGDTLEMLAPEVVVAELFFRCGEFEAAFGVEQALRFEDVLVFA